MKRHTLKMIIGLVLLISTMPSSLDAQQRLVTPDSSDRVLLMKTGRIMKGQVKRVSTGFLVSSGKGYVVVPFNQVQFDADSVREAYLRLRLQQRDPGVATHLALAEWCLSQKLYQESARELRDALNRDPSNETARQMLDRVEREYQQTQPQKQAAVTGEAKLTLIDDRPKTDMPRRSLAGLSTKTAQQFVTKVQPILLNRCGNVRCHGASAKNDFRLARMSYGSGRHRLKVERNLAAVLKQINLDDPSVSPLLEVSKNIHAGQSVFKGTHSAKQISTLHQWAWSAARELQPRPAVSTASFAQLSPGQVPQRQLVRQAPISSGKPSNNTPSPLPRVDADGLIEFDPADPSASLKPEETSVRSSKPLIRKGVPQDAPTGGEREASAVQQLLREKKVDPFSPDEFNRRIRASR